MWKKKLWDRCLIEPFVAEFLSFMLMSRVKFVDGVRTV